MLMHSISINASYTLRLKQGFTIAMLQNLTHLCDALVHGSMYKDIFLVAFFGYLHLSLLVLFSKFHKFHLQRSHFTPHSLGIRLTFHRSGATYSFNQNVSFEDIRLHGSWKVMPSMLIYKPPLLLIRLQNIFNPPYKL